MIGRSHPALQQAGSKQDMKDTAHAAETFVNKGEHCALILDRLGRILSCGAPAEKIFGASPLRLAGRRISEFIQGLFGSESSPSYSARYLVHLCADGEWRTFEATDVDGQGFMVELNLARVVTDGKDIFLLNVRRHEDALRR